VGADAPAWYTAGQEEMKNKMDNLYAKLCNMGANEMDRLIGLKHSTTGLEYPNFPLTRNALNTMGHGECNAFLNFYGIEFGVQGLSHEVLVQKQNTIKRFIGIRMG